MKMTPERDARRLSVRSIFERAIQEEDAKELLGTIDAWAALQGIHFSQIEAMKDLLQTIADETSSKYDREQAALALEENMRRIRISKQKK